MALDARKVLPTKINLIRLKREEKVIRKVRKVMEEKREVLLLYIRQAVEDYEKYYNESMKLLMDLYGKFYLGVAEDGFAKVSSLAGSVEPSLEVDEHPRTLFAVKVSSYSLRKETVPKVVFPPGSSPYLVESQKLMEQLFPRLLKLAELEESLRKLISELKETQRLINAIDYVILPSYERVIKFIRMILEERMREEFIRLKLLKRKLERREQEAAAA